MENIERSYEELLKTFLHLETEEEKIALAKQYAPFLNLAKSLQQQADDFHTERNKQYYHIKFNTHFLKPFIHEWRELVIRLYGEEYLDDFQYLQAIAHGVPFSMLAKRKLISPVKLAVLLIQSILLLICKIALYLWTPLITTIVNDLHQNIYHIQQAPSLLARLIPIISLTLKVLAAIGISVAVSHLCSPILIYLIPIPFFMKALEVIGSPIDQIIRPVSQYLGISPILPSLLLMSAVGFALLSASSLIAVVELALHAAALTLSLIQLTLYAQLIIKLYKTTPLPLFIIGGFLLCSFIVSDTPLPVANETPIAPLTLIDLINLIIDQSLQITILSAFIRRESYTDETAKAEENKIIEQLPLPATPVPDAIKHATLLATKQASQSHRFFNTRKEAHYIPPSDRTFLQQCSSFFGNGEIKPPHLPRPSKQLMHAKACTNGV